MKKKEGCPYCGETYKNPIWMQRHVKNIHLKKVLQQQEDKKRITELRGFGRSDEQISTILCIPVYDIKMIMRNEQ